MITIIDYGMGNLKSVENAFTTLNCDVSISNKPTDIRRADRIVLPGVGAFADGMNNLKKYGLIDLLYKEIIIKKKPFLGICLGMQLLAESSEEFGFNNGLGWINGHVKRIIPNSKVYKIPHMGWNSLIIQQENPLYLNIEDEPTVYFVHSYHYVVSDNDNRSASCEYGCNITASIQKDNIYGVQYHPEKSQKVGLSIIRNFCNI